MDRKSTPFIPTESLKIQRVEIYINDLQEQLHRLRSKYDTIFTECCDIQKKIQEVSTETMAKQQEIGQIITEFEELRLSNANRHNILRDALVQKVGDVRRLREKFETMCRENFTEFIARGKQSIDKIQSGQTSSKPQSSYEKPVGTFDDQDSELWSTFESFYSFISAPVLDTPESPCLDENKVSEALD